MNDSQPAGAASLYPGAVRAKPQALVGELGRHAVHYLLDRLFRSLVWGADESEPGTLELTALTDFTLKLRRYWTGQESVFGALEGEWPDRGSESMMADCFERCLAGIRSGDFEQLDWVAGNPYLAIFLPVAVALSSEAKVVVNTRGRQYKQSYLEGVPQKPLEWSENGCTDSSLELEIKLDAKLLDDELQVYPFRIRLREFASLVPGLDISLKYKSFKPKNFKSEHGMRDLLEFYVPEEDRLHEIPFVFRHREGDLEYECAIFLIHSAMERIKAYVDFDESYHGGLHERLLRKTIRGVLRRIHKLEIPIRRQSLEMIASSRMSYFGQFGSTVPYQRDQRRNEYVRTVPGVAATLRVRSPEVEWDTNFRARLMAPKMEKEIGPKLSAAFRTWVLQHSETIEEWRKQWIPKKRRKPKKKKKKKKPEEPKNLKTIDKELSK